MTLHVSVAHCAFAVILSAASPNASYQDASRPNLLLAIADDWGWPHASAYGDPVVETPAFDRVAREGIRFDHAYTASPSCTPARNAILTGQFHWRLGPGANLHSTLDPSTPVYPHLLSDAGYHVGSWRKSWGPGRLTGWTEHPAGKVHKGGFEEFLAARPDGAPFCFWLGSSDPHRGYRRHSGVESGMDLDKVPLFDCHPDHPDVRGDIADYYFEVQRFDRDVAAVIEKLEEIGELDNTLIVVTSDHGMPFPRCKSNLYDSGVRVPLAMRWGARVAAGQTFAGFVGLTDLAPTFLEAAGIAVPDVMTGVGLLPVLCPDNTTTSPTVRDHILFGKERHVPAQEAHRGGYPCRGIRTARYLLIHNYEPDRWPAGTPHHSQAAIANAWLADCDNGPTKSAIVELAEGPGAQPKYWELCFGKRPEWELYDCVQDPGQVHNVADDPTYADVVAELRAQLQAGLLASGDPRASGAGDEFDTYPYYGGAPKHPSAEKR